MRLESTQRVQSDIPEDSYYKRSGLLISWHKRVDPKRDLVAWKKRKKRNNKTLAKIEINKSATITQKHQLCHRQTVNRQIEPTRALMDDVFESIQE